MDPAQRIIVEAVFGSYVGMTKHRIKRIKGALGGARVVELWVRAISYSSRMRQMCFGK
jgi:hypothetical protein